jgi:hypothetical protein
MMSRLLEKFISALALLLIGAMFAAFFIEFAAGCGETYVDANGVRHAHECVFLKRSPK